MYRYLTRLSLGLVASAAVIFVGFTSMTGPAYATHDSDHSIEEIKGGLKALEARVWNCETGFDDTCLGTTGEQGDQGVQGKLGDTGDQGVQGKLGDTGAQGVQGKLGSIGPEGPAASQALLDGLQAQLDNLALLAFEQASAFVFVTSMKYTGNLGGISGANDKCNARASAAGLPGVYKAWISIGPGSDPNFNFSKATGPYIRPDGVRVADDYNDLVTEDGSSGVWIKAPITVTETGAAVVVDGTEQVWSNVQASGIGLGQVDCVNWSDEDPMGGFMGVVGLLGEVGQFWGGSATVEPCATTKRLYCFGQ